MPHYQPSSVSGQYTHMARPPFPDKISFTLDHLQVSTPAAPGTADIVRYLTARDIPVTVFVRCAEPRNGCPRNRPLAEEVYRINPRLVTLGVHSRSKTRPRQEQLDNLAAINNMIEDITGKKSMVMSYHGKNAGPVPGFSFPGMRYCRGITSKWSSAGFDGFNTPVVSANTIKKCYAEVAAMNKSGLVPTLFFHSHELSKAPGHRIFKSRFDNFVNDIVHKNLQAVHYLEAMETSLNPGSAPVSGGDTDDSDTPTITRRFRVSASEIGTLRPVKVDYIIEDADGRQVGMTQNKTTELFTLPVGDYIVRARVNNQERCHQHFTLTVAGGLHVILYV